MPPSRSSWRVRLALFWRRHRTLLWALHSVWALATGVVVIILSRERYGFVPWVVGFLVATWASTLFFARSSQDPDATGSSQPGLGAEVSSYATRHMYQETLFFLLPFYAYSTVWGSPSLVFVGVLALLAILSCLDLVFDRWLRTSAIFGMMFFASVAFAALNLLLPLLIGLDPTLADRAAILLAVGSALPLALRAGLPTRRAKLTVGAGGVVFVAVFLLFPQLVPPVPLRLDSATFASDIERSTLEPIGVVEERATSAELGARMIVLVRVFAPGPLPASVRLEWSRDGIPVRTSDAIRITAHDEGFRVWDGLPASRGRVEPGAWKVVLRTDAGSVFGIARLEVVDEPTAARTNPPAGPRVATGASPRIDEFGAIARIFDVARGDRIEVPRDEVRDPIRFSPSLHP